MVETGTAAVDREAVTSRADRPDRLDHATSPARIVETLTFKVVALVVASSVAILLWQFTLRVIGYAAGQLGRDTQTATVVACARTLGVDGPCVVSYGSPPQQGHLTSPGLFAMSPGDLVPIVTRGDGTVGLGGWQPIFDASLLLVLAVIFTGYAIGWWRRVLEHTSPTYDGGEPSDYPEDYLRGPR